MAENRAKMLARLKAMRKKHGLGEFKSQKTSSARRITGAKPMARRRYTRIKRGFSSGGNMLKQASAGIGASVLVNKFGGQMLGQWSGLASLGAAYYAGGAPGVIGSLLVGTANLGSIGGTGSGQSAVTFY